MFVLKFTRGQILFPTHYNKHHMECTSLYSHFEYSGGEVSLYFTQALTAAQSADVSTSESTYVDNDQLKLATLKVKSRINKGMSTLVEFEAENEVLGIDADSMTSTVQSVMQETIEALLTGSLLVAIERMREIPAIQKDGKYVSDARLLSIKNTLEIHLGAPVTTIL